MSKTAVLFAGQGAQKTGMGKSLYDTNSAAREIIDRAEAHSPGLREMCFTGTQELLNQTINTQPCVFTVDVAAYAAFAAIGVPMRAAAGFSLGEYAALVCAGVLSFEKGLSLVKNRAEWMQAQAEATGGGMAAVLGKTGDEVDEMVASLHAEGILAAVNYNCPGQTVVAGDETNLSEFLSYCKQNKVKAMRLPVNGAFHSKAMAPVSDLLFNYLSSLQFGNSFCPVYSNVLARPYEENEWKKILAAQTSKPVYFEHILRDMLHKGIRTFVEVGPGNTLSGFLKRIDKDVAVYNVQDADSLEATAAALKEEMA